MKPADQPLKVSIEDDQLVIRIGIDTLAFAAEHCPRFYDYEKDQVRLGPPYAKVVDKPELAHDIIQAMTREEEDGSSPLSHFLDNVIVDAYEDGSLGFDDETYALQR